MESPDFDRCEANFMPVGTLGEKSHSHSALNSGTDSIVAIDLHGDR